MPIVIHSRDSMAESIGVVREHRNSALRGIFHCFGGSVDEANEIIGLGFYLGIGGVVTYKNSGLAAVLAQVGLDHVVLETDAPYLAPVPFRGKRNESAYLRFILEKIASIVEISAEQVAALTTANAQKIFGR
jgi:TatD DNase family protein